MFAGLVWAFAALYASAQVNYVPLEFRTVEGIRPFVSVQLNGTPFVFMVHSNASFYVMTTHANAAQGWRDGDAARCELWDRCAWACQLGGG